MARALKLLLPQLEQLAAHIAMRPFARITEQDRSARALSAQSQSTRRLGEHLELWQILRFVPLTSGQRLEEIARNSGMLHHQIQHERGAQQFALSRPNDDPVGHPDVVGVFTSHLAQRIHDGIRWIDDHAADDSEVARLLWAPAVGVHALWLRGEAADRLLIVNKPNLGGALAYRKLHDVSTFLATLARRRPGLVKRGPTT